MVFVEGLLHAAFNGRVLRELVERPSARTMLLGIGAGGFGVEGHVRARKGTCAGRRAPPRDRSAGGLQLILEILRRDLLAAGGGDDVLLAVGDGQVVAVSVSPMSPVANHPSGLRTSAVFSAGRYPRKTPGPFTMISPSAAICFGAGHRWSDRPDLDPPRQVDAGRGAGLRSPYLQDSQPHLLEEVGDLGLSGALLETKQGSRLPKRRRAPAPMGTPAGGR